MVQEKKNGSLFFGLQDYRTLGDGAGLPPHENHTHRRTLQMQFASASGPGIHPVPGAVPGAVAVRARPDYTPPRSTLLD